MHPHGGSGCYFHVMTEIQTCLSYRNKKITCSVMNIFYNILFPCKLLYINNSRCPSSLVHHLGPILCEVGPRERWKNNNSQKGSYWIAPNPAQITEGYNQWFETSKPVRKIGKLTCIHDCQITQLHIWFSNCVPRHPRASQKTHRVL